MQKLWSNPLLRSRYPLAIFAGLFWTAAFPKIGVAGLAWVAPGMLTAAALGTTAGESFRLGYVGGLTHYLTMLYWLLLIPYRWHGIPFGPALGWLALSAFVALFPATWVWMAAPRRQELEARPNRSPSTNWSTALPRNWILRLLWTLSGAAAWVGLEMLLSRIFGGFAWDLLGVSQYRMTPLIQISSVTGVYGVSFLAVWVSLSLVAAGVMVIQRPTARSVWVPEVFVPVITVAVLFNFGLRQLRSAEETGRTVSMTLIQPSIPQTLIWDASNDTLRFDELIQLSEQALTNHTDIVVWPEAAVPRMLRYDKETFEGITGLARRHHVWMIVGSDDAEPRPGKTAREADYFNSSFLISPEGKLIERYVKRNLVMFGEYVPLHQFLPFLKYLTPIEGGFTPGTNTVSFDLVNLHTKTQVLICFEDTFPHLAREELGADIDFLVNLTNDGWFGQGAAQWQQAATGLFRAVENHLPLVRCANNGLTCWVDERGILRDIFRDASGSVYGKGFMTIQVPLPPPGTLHELTFYTCHGDWFGWGCVAIGVGVFGRKLWRQIEQRRRLRPAI
ncbi:MAG TPA: apolipoprotein N-acyltransferase [Verrucomicrobiae bacterium]|nr:apolipoprotein N-acyltransferase [Verrucomicrobiae bacterium]